MNYRRIYDNIISNSMGRTNNGYTENHHIIPRCMGGGDESTNMATLTAREHYLCHWLLHKMYGGLLTHAWVLMIANHNGKRYTSWTFKYAREAFAAKMRRNNPMKCPETARRSMNTRAENGNSLNRRLSEEEKVNISKRMKDNNPMSGVDPWNNPKTRSNPKSMEIWIRMDELYKLWYDNPKKQGYGAFRTLAVANGFPDCKYANMTEKFKNDLTILERHKMWQQENDVNIRKNKNIPSI